MATVGSGKYTYELVEDWAKLPDGWTLGQTGIVTDSQDRVYLFNRSDHPLIVLDRDGNYLTSWGEGVLTAAHGMFIDGDENIYLPVINSHVVPQVQLRRQPADDPGNVGPAIRHRLVGQRFRHRAAGRRSVPPPQRRGHVSGGRPVHLRRLRQRPCPQVLRRPASCNSPGGRRARPEAGSSTFPTGSGYTPTDGYSSPTGRTTAFRYSAPRVSTWPSGPACPAPATSTSTRTRPCSSPSWTPL